MKTATVLQYDRLKGWGFALPDDGSTDIFCHRANLPESRRYLNPGERIEYDLGERSGRTNVALNIRLTSPPAPESEGARR